MAEKTESDEDCHFLSLKVTDDQETALEAFFQINGWQLVKEAVGEKTGPDTYHPLFLQVTPEQESALIAFFQINNWAVMKESDSSVAEITEENTGDLFQNESTINQETPVEAESEEGRADITDYKEVQLTTQDENGVPQVLSVYASEDNLKDLPKSILDYGDGEEKESDVSGEVSQVIIQEITLPEGMSLDHNLLLASTAPEPVKRVTPRGTMKPGDKVYKCNICDKVFKQVASFNGHYQTHYGEKPYKCDTCNTGFTLKAALVAHQSIHSGAKPFECYVCNKGFRRKDDMMSHLRTHTGEKPYECDICGQKFKYRNQIPKHKRTHTGEKPYECPTCEKRFTSNIHLTRHIRVHTGERPYKCTICDKAFTQFGHLQAHVRIHTNERPYECEVCGRRFREKKVMKRHEQLHSQERKFKCGECGRGFLRQSNLDLHSVMHQKGGNKRITRRPKPKKNVDAEMREFVANVLSNVKKVDSSVQTDAITKPAAVHTVAIESDTNGSSSVDNNSGLVSLAVEQNNVAHIGNISDLQTLVDNDQQITLVMNDDGSGSYLISTNSDVPDEIVNQLPSQQIEVTVTEDETAAQQTPPRTVILCTDGTIADK